MYKRIFSYTSSKLWFIFLTICVAMIMVCSSAADATLGGEPETPQPTFKRDGDEIVASLIPRAKSSKVLINFSVSGGRLTEVTGKDFKSTARPEVDHKDFKSDLFNVSVTDVPKGGEIYLDISSDFFSKSTEFWGFNPDQEPSWMNTNADNQSQTDRIRTLRVTAQDGGPLDTDGATNGRLSLIGGPKDSFWGYALGTLFIRFFGIFLVLSVLMVGMMLAGRIFRRVEDGLKRDEQPLPDQGSPLNDSSQTLMAQEAQSSGDPSTVPETAAAIAAALHMHLSALQREIPLQLAISSRNPWTQQGRDRIMSVRSINIRRK